MEGFSLSEWSTDRTEGAVFVNQSEVRRWFDFLYVSVPALHMLILQSKDAYQRETAKKAFFRLLNTTRDQLCWCWNSHSSPPTSYYMPSIENLIE